MSKKLTEDQVENLLDVLEKRFLTHIKRHPKMNWTDIKERIENNQDILWSLSEMERTGGEPDVVGNGYVYVDCSKETPSGRRSICYDRKALDARKKNKPKNDAMTIAQDMGLEMLDEEDYRNLQAVGEFDVKTSSWIKTPQQIRELGGALFADRRYNHVFIYHSGAESYYASRSFRGKVKI